ncbi:hypothetical protein MHYP_G00146810 [Metynnis hypsauchen]
MKGILQQAHVSSASERKEGRSTRKLATGEKEVQTPGFYEEEDPNAGNVTDVEEEEEEENQDKNLVGVKPQAVIRGSQNSQKTSRWITPGDANICSPAKLSQLPERQQLPMKVLAFAATLLLPLPGPQDVPRPEMSITPRKLNAVKVPQRPDFSQTEKKEMNAGLRNIICIIPHNPAEPAAVSLTAAGPEAAGEV